MDAFEKSKKRQQAEKKRMKQELVSYMNRVQNSSAPASDVRLISFSVVLCVYIALVISID